jgi:imidazolonepropionase-like amidohydrolase
MNTGDGNLSVINALIFDGRNGELTEGSIRISRGEIVEVGKITRADETCIDAQGSVVTPGLIDNHCHAYGIGLDMLSMEASPLSYVALVARHRLAGALRRGFTTIRDVAGGDIGLRMAIEQGLLLSPRYFYTGPALSQTGGHGDPRPAELDLCLHSSHGTEVVDGVDNLRRAVRELFRRGAHAIKIMTSGGVVSPTDPIRIPQYSAAEIQAVTDEARRRGSYVAAHSYSPESIMHSVKNGVRSIEHGNLLDDESARAMAEHSAFLVPTLAAFDAMSRRGAEIGMTPIALNKNKEVLDSGLSAIEIAQQHKVKVGFGTDLMGVLEDDQLQGLRLQHEVQGMLELLKSVTSVNAEILQQLDLGGIKIGMRGDLLIVGGDPFTKPELLWQPAEKRRVILAGNAVV